jgi:hypothetical protein
MKSSLIISIFILLFSASTALASGVILRLGPAGLGHGGPNPLGIPPTTTDMELSYVSNSKWEFNLGIPGVFVGGRYQKNWGGYVSLGGGIVIDANAAGPGIYSAFGYDFGWNLVRFNIEYKQAVGVSSVALISPYAVRFGVGIWF